MICQPLALGVDHCLRAGCTDIGRGTDGRGPPAPAGRKAARHELVKTANRLKPPGPGQPASEKQILREMLGTDDISGLDRDRPFGLVIDLDTDPAKGGCSSCCRSPTPPISAACSAGSDSSR